MRRNELGKALKKFQAIDKVRRPSLPAQTPGSQKRARTALH